MKQKLCSYCSAPLDMDAENLLCEYCGHTNIHQGMERDEQDELSKAAELRNEEYFDDAERIYNRLLIQNSGNFQARWGRLLCRYGIVYIEEDDGSRILTCRKTVESEFTEETDYHLVCDHPKNHNREVFIRDGEAIMETQQKIHSLAKSQVPYDIFICYKESIKKADDTKDRTVDSLYAEELYTILLHQDYRVFYAPETLKGMKGSDYEARIFNAIETSKVMLVIGSRIEYLTSTFVQSEWRRFLKRKENDPSKMLIPMYLNMRPENMPEELSKVEAIDIDEDEPYYSVLIRNLRRHFGKKRMIPKSANNRMDLVKDGNLHFLEKRYKEAEKCYREAAQKGNVMASYLLGTMYYTGDGVEEDLEAAVHFYEKAAKGGYADAQYQLAFMYEMGIGVAKNISLADEWYNEAGEQDCSSVPKEYRLDR